MSSIYVPTSNQYNKCYVVQNEDIIRAYDTTPNNNTSYNYRDYYIHSDYIFRDGSGTWGAFTTLPVCLPSSQITNDIFYRVDLSQIIIIFTFFALLSFYIPMKIFMRLFRRLN